MGADQAVVVSDRRRLFSGLLGLMLGAPQAIQAPVYVVFDPNTGMGYLDSGVVLFVLGWDTQRLQDEAAALGFILAEKSTYTGECSTGGVLPTTARIDMMLKSTIQFDGSTVTGFTLDGKESGQEIRWQAVPQVGMTCVESNVAGTWVSIEFVSSEHHLYVGYKGLQIHLWPGTGHPGNLRAYCQ